jgi:ATP-binding cassette subfamily B (MDR/TAP) protein 1
MKKEDNKKHHKIVKHNSSSAVSFFKLQYYGKDYIGALIMTCAILSSLGLGIAMPYFSVLFGRSINNFGVIIKDHESRSIALENITYLAKQFVYVGAGMFITGFLMVWLWIYTGQKTVKTIKEEYFSMIMSQEQAWFDIINPYEFSTKIKYETQMIEHGVRFYLITGWRESRTCYYVNFNGCSFPCRWIYYILET